MKINICQITELNEVPGIYSQQHKLPPPPSQYGASSLYVNHKQRQGHQLVAYNKYVYLNL